MTLRRKVLLGVMLASVFAVIVFNLVAVRSEVGRLNEAVSKDAITLVRIVDGSTAGVGARLRQVIPWTLASSARIQVVVIYTEDGPSFAWCVKGRVKSSGVLLGNLKIRS